MNFVAQAAALNNDGLHLIVADDIARAKQCFIGALQIIQNAIMQNLHNEGEQPVDFTLGFGNPSAFEFEDTGAVLSSLAHTSAFFLRDNAILLNAAALPSNQGARQRNVAQDAVLSLYAAVILFNLALVAHHEGYTSNESNLGFAEVYYEGSIAILAGYKNDEIASVELSEAMTAITLLALNNQMVVHYDRCNYDKAQQCLVEVKNIIRFLHQCHTRLPNEFVQRLNVNTCIQVPPPSAKAA